MDINAIIMAWMLSMNILMSQGNSYDYTTNTVVPKVQTRELSQDLRYSNPGSDVYVDRSRIKASPYRNRYELY